ncbi:hypothetical protein [Pseudomonas fluorescens]|uniref:hypothetical protein n=1 Tax=Pseudomonas fluorescens TaxID=294 RepID=UPI000F8206E7|nr:hypothetical protein [Pseudomonas fluorescens]
MSSTHSPSTSPDARFYSAHKQTLSRRQTLARLGLLFMAGPLGITAQHVDWKPWNAEQRPVVAMQTNSAISPAQRRITSLNGEAWVSRTRDAAATPQGCGCPESLACTTAPACVCQATPCR